jgi:hypothetical protein
MIKVSIPDYKLNEKKYIVEVLLCDFLGINCNIETGSKNFEITNTESDTKLIISDVFFDNARKCWIKPNSMPALPLSSWNPLLDDNLEAKLVDQDIPILFGKPGLLKKQNYWFLNLDIFGSAFFMLSRYEEFVIQDKDEHNRFSATSSIAYKANFLERPIINEYLEILWCCIHSLWPEIQRKKRTFRKLISCDVDHPYDLVDYSLKRIILRVGARLIRDRNPLLALYDGLNYLFTKVGSNHFDQYRSNIDWMIRVNKKHGNKVAFYFIPIQTDPVKDDKTDIKSKRISALLRHIDQSGHEVGIHPGYNSYKSPDIFKQSVDILKDACQSVGIDISSLGGRQHYLRFDIDQTPLLWQENGLVYDSSLFYADRPGFRAGVCYEFTMYSLSERKKMALKQRPLIIMDHAVIKNKSDDVSCIVNRVNIFRSICEKYNGDFTLLWHNSSFGKKAYKKAYIKIIS